MKFIVFQFSNYSNYKCIIRTHVSMPNYLCVYAGAFLSSIRSPSKMQKASLGRDIRARPGSWTSKTRRRRRRRVKRRGERASGSRVKGRSQTASPNQIGERKRRVEQQDWVTCSLHPACLFSELHRCRTILPHWRSLPPLSHAATHSREPCPVKTSVMGIHTHDCSFTYINTLEKNLIYTMCSLLQM